MAKFFYQARRGPEKLEQGIIEADSQPAAINKLTQMGYFPISVTTEEAKSFKEKPQRMRLFRKVPNRDLTTFTRQLSNLIESGLTLYRALNILHQQTENQYLKIVIHDLADLVKEGQSLSESLRRYPQIFSNMYVSIIRAGELSGALDKVLERLADFGEKQEDFLAKVRAAMAYPIFMLLVGTLTVVVLFTFVIPKLIVLFEDLGQSLPLSTRILIAISDFLVNFWWLILAVALVFFFSLRRNLFTAKGRLAIDRFKLGLPLFGQFLKKSQMANLSRTLATLLGNGVPILQAMDSVAQTMGNEVLKQEVKKIAVEIKEGSSLAHGVSKSKYFPVLVANMITIGEEGGKLDASLLKVSEAYEKETDQSIRILTSLIEPIMILVMGSIVGFIVISMLLPIFQITLIAH